jgi:hypothetical protein
MRAILITALFRRTPLANFAASSLFVFRDHFFIDATHVVVAHLYRYVGRNSFDCLHHSVFDLHYDSCHLIFRSAPALVILVM